MKTLKLIGLFLAGLIVGGVAVSLRWSHILSGMMISKEVEVAAKTAFEAEWLAELRLGETNRAITSLENSMDIDLVTIAQWAEVAPPDEKTRKARDRWLVPAKVYHENYPVRGDEAVRVNSLLATVPERSPNSTCKNGICRLDDLHRGITNGANAPLSITNRPVPQP